MEQSNMWMSTSNTTQKNLADPQEEENAPTSSGVVAARSKAKAKPQPRESTGATTIPLSEKNMDWYWIITTRSRVVQSLEESRESSSTQSEVTSRRRWSNSILQDKILSTRPSSSNTKLVRWSMDSLFGCRRRIPNEDISIALINLGSILYLRALQGHSGSNLIDPALQDNVLIGPGIFPYIYHVGSNFNLHSIISNGLILGGSEFE